MLLISHIKLSVQSIFLCFEMMSMSIATFTSRRFEILKSTAKQIPKRFLIWNFLEVVFFSRPPVKFWILEKILQFGALYQVIQNF